MLLGAATLQPGETLDYDIDYDEWLNSDDDLVTPPDIVISAAGLDVPTPVIIESGRALKLWVSAITPGTYKVTVTTTTRLGRIKQDEIKVRVKDV